jgi:hypothetical protein
MKSAQVSANGREVIVSETSSLRDSQSPVSASASPDLQQIIRQRAEEIYMRNGGIAGRDLENWAQAEREIRHEQSSRRTAIVVKVNGARYVGEYAAESSGGYLPGELGAGASVAVRFAGDKMFVKRPNGKELETKIIEKRS